MTTPMIEFANPIKEYTLKPSAQGSVATLFITHPISERGNTYPSVHLEKGVNEIIVSWDGSAEVNVYYGPDTSWAQRRLAGRVPAGARNTTRRLTFTVPVDTNDYVVYMQTNASADDMAYRVGMRVINNTALFNNL